MGYYLDFIFDEPGITHEEVMKRLLGQGSTVIEEYYKDNSLSEKDKRYYETHIPMRHSRLGEYYPHLSVFKKEANSPKGCWADIRLSWAGDPDDFLQVLENIIAIAESIGCRVYDGQIDDFLTSDNLKKALVSFFGGATWVESNIGKIE